MAQDGISESAVLCFFALSIFKSGRGGANYQASVRSLVHVLIASLSNGHDDFEVHAFHGTDARKSLPCPAYPDRDVGRQGRNDR
jgi:hypothetical protein